MRPIKTLCLAFLASILFQIGAAPGIARAAEPTTAPSTQPSHPLTLYIVGYAHLDTQWRWSYPGVIREYIRKTMEDNFPLLEKYPHYIFNFTGARRYMFMKEYYPEDYAKVKQYIAAGRWFPAGSSVDENDVNIPSAESIIRHVLYGNQYFKKEFGVASNEYMLPDCFGFPYCLPSILSHCGIKGFNTQKLTWGSTVGIPFNVGMWEGPDGQSVLAALNPGSYTSKVTTNLANDPTWIKRIEEDGDKSGVYVDFHYFGTGDKGGAPAEDSIKHAEESVTTNGAIKVVEGFCNAMFNAITPAQEKTLPRYKGELLLTQHSAGAATSETFMKRMNRKNEVLADAAERAAVTANWLGVSPYPAKALYDAWILVLGSQMHDMAAGTTLPKALEFCWNDEFIAANHFADVLTSSTGAVTSAMDTRGKGTSVAVFNPTSIAREDVVDATISMPGVPAVKVIGPDGKETPAQVVGRAGDQLHVLFLAKMPSVGYSIFDIQPADQTSGDTAKDSPLKVSETSLENDRFKVTIDANGDVSSIVDKKTSQEVLSAPARMAFLHESPQQYPAWNMDWDDVNHPPYAYVDGKPTIRIVENGPARVAVEITRDAQGSKFTQCIRLAAGEAGDRVEFDNHVDWKTKGSCLKAVFPLVAANPETTYGIQVGTVERENGAKNKYEFPHHQWIDTTDAGGKFGASILDDCKFGSDKPNDNTVRLTLLYTPSVRRNINFQDQASQDWGKNQFLYAITSHSDGWQSARIPLIAQRLNQPLLAFAVPAHDGKLGKTFSLCSIDSDQVMITAIKKAEATDETIVRMKEITGGPAKDVHVKFAVPVIAAREVDGQENSVDAPGGNSAVKDGQLVADVGAYRLRAFAVKLGPAPDAGKAPASQSVDLPFDSDVVSLNSNRADGSFDADGRTYPGEQFPQTLDRNGVTFKFGSTDDGAKNAVTCHGQSIDLPKGDFDRVYLIASADGDQTVNFGVGDKQVPLTIQNWGGYIGQWDNRIWKGEVPELPGMWHNSLDGLAPGWVKPSALAWFCTHRHHPANGDEYYQFSYLFRYALDVPSGTKSIKLPDNAKVRIFAISAVQNDTNNAIALQPLSDTLSDHKAGGAPTLSVTEKPDHSKSVTLNSPLYWQEGRLHYTLDGSAPTDQSPTYTEPLTLGSATEIKAVETDASGNASQLLDQKVEAAVEK